MNFNAVVAAVLDITKRPDKTADTERAVNAALSFFCLKDSFAQDLIEQTLAIDPSKFGDTISLASLTRFRRFKYIKVTGVLGYLQPIGADKVFTGGSVMQKNCYYVAGTNLTYILPAQASSLEVGYYTYPSILSGNNTHWMLDMFPNIIINRAAANIFKSIGDDNSFKIHNSLAMEEFLVLQGDLNQGG